ncbi:MAG: DUF3500 domain-containing protein, partial [Chloroflexi bacterium]|nr:DUF3500 domain-containing protein [Chloroflexota bacterium]
MRRLCPPKHQTLSNEWQTRRLRSWHHSARRNSPRLPFRSKHYTPVDRNGLLISEMSGNQIYLAYKMMETGYSASGYQMARQIISLEPLLGEYEAMTNNVSTWQRLEERYWFSVFGEPGSDSPWGWRVGGHHIGIVASVVGNSEVSIHPLFFGSNPAEVKHGEHKGMRTLAEEEDWA